MWFRLYTELLNDPKVQRLSGDQFKGWVNILCLAKESDGALPSVDDIAFRLRISDEEAEGLVETLVSRGLLDSDGQRLGPHNWEQRQYNADVSTERVKRYRQKHRNVSEPFHETVSFPTTDTDTESDTEQSTETETESCADAPVVSSSPEVGTAFAYWQAALNHPTAKLTPKRKKLIEARLKDGYTLVDIQKAIDGCRASPFHMGQNEGGTVYDDIELICRNGEKLESFISRSNGNGQARVTHKETPNQRAAREYQELAQRSLAEAIGDIGPDTADTGTQRPTIEVRGF